MGGENGILKRKLQGILLNSIFGSLLSFSPLVVKILEVESRDLRQLFQSTKGGWGMGLFSVLLEQTRHN